jgi:hypothetical protein
MARLGDMSATLHEGRKDHDAPQPEALVIRVSAKAA